MLIKFLDLIAKAELWIARDFDRLPGFEIRDFALTHGDLRGITDRAFQQIAIALPVRFTLSFTEATSL